MNMDKHGFTWIDMDRRDMDRHKETWIDMDKHG